MKKRSEHPIPKAREEDLVVQMLQDEVLVYDLKIHEAHCLNQTAALVWKQCDGKKTVPEIASLVKQKSQMPVDEEVVWYALDRLGRANLLQSRIKRADGTAPISRRQVVGKLGLAAALAVPMVMSISSPTAAQATSVCVGTCGPTTACKACLQSGKCTGVCGSSGGALGTCFNNAKQAGCTV
jgi:hypothetical protein